MLTTDGKEEKEKDTTSKEEKKTKEPAAPSTEEVAGEELSSSENSQNCEAKNMTTQPVQMSTIKQLTPEQCEKLVGYTFISFIVYISLSLNILYFISATFIL